MTTEPLWSLTDGCGYCGATRRALGQPLALDNAGDLVCPAGTPCAAERATVTLAGVEVSPSARRSPEAVPPRSAATRAALAMAEAELTLCGPSDTRKRPVPTLDDVADAAEVLAREVERFAEWTKGKGHAARKSEARRIEWLASDLRAMRQALRDGAWR